VDVEQLNPPTEAVVETTPIAPRATPEQRDQYPPGMVFVPCHDLARYHGFTNDLVLLDVPDGTEINFTRSSSIVQNFNLGVETMLQSQAQWMWVIGDDHMFGRDVVLRLLKHDVDIVAPLCVRRGPPFTLVAFDEAGSKVDADGNPLYHMLDMDDLPDHGLMPIPATGSAGMLIKRSVFEALEPPWFRNGDLVTVNEDVIFCERVREELGLTVWLDVDTYIGHLGTFCAMPMHQDGRWGLMFDFLGRGENRIFLPGGVKPGDPRRGVTTASGKW